MTLPVPDGWRVRLDPRTRRVGTGLRLLTPTGRLLRLGRGGEEALAHLEEGVASERERRLGRSLLAAGAAFPVVSSVSADDVTVVIPVRDRTAALSRCLAAVGSADVIVVDDGSADPDSVRAVAEGFGVRYLHRLNGGPAAARNSALPLLHKDFVAFLDSDCVPPTGWLEQLRAHLDDPAVAAVAPRVVGGPRSPLDLGPHAARVIPGGEVSYVPTACLLFRVSALTPFDERLRYGEDVDLVWRTIDGGWDVRYDPSVVVQHEEPPLLRDRLIRRYRYGQSAGPLAQRHPTRLAHLVVSPWPTAVVVLLHVRRPLLALAAAATMTIRLDRTIEDPPTSAWAVGQGVRGQALGLGRALGLLGPLGWLLVARHRRLAPVLVAPYLVEWNQRRPPLNPVAFGAVALLDQAAYGAGVVAGCLRHRTGRPLLPKLSAENDKTLGNAGVFVGKLGLGERETART